MGDDLIMNELKELREKRSLEMEKAEKAISEEKPEEAKDAMEEIKKLDERITALEEKIKKDEGKEEPKEEPKEPELKSNTQGEQRNMKQFKPSINQEQESAEVRDFIHFLRTKGEKRENVTSVEADVVIPKDIVTQPVKLPETVVDLK